MPPRPIPVSKLPKQKILVNQRDIDRLAPLITKLINETHGTTLTVADLKYTLTPETIQGLIPNEKAVSELGRLGPQGAARFSISLA